MKQAPTLPRSQALSALEALDLSIVSLHMCGPTYLLTPWTSKLIKTCEILYKRFLQLNICYPDDIIVPTRDIDEFWHAHILHSKQYMQDCEALFGYYLHHQPSRSDDSSSLKPHFERTKILYRDTFGENLQVLLRKRS